MSTPSGALRATAVSALPWLALLTIASGAANVIVVLAVTATLNGASLASQIDRFVFACLVYLLARRAVETRLIQLTSDLVYDTRARLLRQVLAMPYAAFERLDRGSVYTAICEETTTVGNAASVLVTLVTSLVSIAAAFVCLFLIHPGLAALMAFVVAAISYAYSRKTAGTRGAFDRARTSWNGFVARVHDALDGAKELALHAGKRQAFCDAADVHCERSRRDSLTARFAHLDAFLFGETLLLAALGAVAFAPIVINGLDAAVRTSFVVILLYLIGPARAALAAVPSLVQARIAWQRLERFAVAAAPGAAGASSASSAAPSPGALTPVQTLELDAIAFQYQREDGQGMRVGPVSLTVRRGECLFITGGNGSGKTTLAKVIAGLYEADEGEMRIDGRRVRGAEASDYAAVVFSPCYVFDRAYGLNVSQDCVGAELERLGLTDRVTRVNDWIDRTALSSGQRKRVALMEACLQDRPILILDEVAADQDPEFRRAYYEQILPASTRRGHIVIVISHDDRWFHLADRVLKLDLGRPVAVDRAERVPA